MSGVRASDFVVRTYSVMADGFPGYTFLAATPARARVRAWWSYCSYRHVTFGEFLKISSIKRAEDHPDLGKEILVGGARAFWVGQDRQYVHFVRPNTDVVVYSHPNDVAAVAR